jgi:hypothetical protein
MGLPTQVLSAAVGSLATFEKPKSQILKRPPLMRMFAGLKSRWMVLSFASY